MNTSSFGLWACLFANNLHCTAKENQFSLHYVLVEQLSSRSGHTLLLFSAAAVAKISPDPLEAELGKQQFADYMESDARNIAEEDVLRVFNLYGLLVIETAENLL